MSIQTTTLSFNKDQVNDDVLSPLPDGHASNYKLISDEGLQISLWVVFAVLCQLIDIFGTVTNVINIICFVKQGFKDPVNISLLGLAISDLGCLVSLIWTNICLTPAFNTADLPFNPEEFQYLTGSWPHVTFTRVSSWITAIITLERCLCITAPLQVKNIVTPRRMAFVTVFVFTILIFSVSPIYVVNSLTLKFYPALNKSLIGLAFTKDRERVEKISFAINNIFVSFSAFTVVIFCTIILVFQLNRKAKWRKKSVSSAQGDSISARNQKVAKMVVMISTLFISCFIPFCVIFLVMSFDLRVSFHGQFRNTAILISGLGFILESINSSMNIFIYYHMSSKYRSTFHDLFFRRGNDEAQKKAISISR